MRVLIFGGRDFGDIRSQPAVEEEREERKRQYAGAMVFLNSLCITTFPRTEEDTYGNYLPEITVITGEARGADSIGTDFAIINWTDYEGHPADWKTHGKAAGFIRNQQMLDSGIDLAVQFPGGRGTADMRRRLDKAGVKVIEYEQT